MSLITLDQVIYVYSVNVNNFTTSVVFNTILNMEHPFISMNCSIYFIMCYYAILSYLQMEGFFLCHPIQSLGLRDRLYE